MEDSRDNQQRRQKFLLEACNYLFGQNTALATTNCPAMVSGLMRLDLAKQENGGSQRRSAA